MKKVILLFLFAIISTYAQSSGEMVSFKGKIANRNSDSIVVSSGNNFVKTIKLNKRGQFEEKFAIPAAGLFKLFDGTEGTILFFKNGYDLELAIDAKKFDESIIFKGNGSKENNFLAKKALSDEVFGQRLEGLLTEEETNFNAELEDRKNSDLTALNGAGVDEDLSKIVTSMIQQEAMMLTQFYKKKQESLKLNGVASPLFAFENFKGGISKLDDFKGKYVYIDVWATWCGPCRAEIPYLKKTEEAFKGKDIVFISISIDKIKDHDKWKKFVDEKKLGGVQLFAGDEETSSEFVKFFGINSIPRFILIDKKGNIIYSDAPRPSSQSLQSTLVELLN